MWHKDEVEFVYQVEYYNMVFNLNIEESIHNTVYVHV